MSLHPIIHRVIVEGGITDIGQLTKEEKKELNRAVKKGFLQLVKDYTFPIEKNRYVFSIEKIIEMLGE